MKDFSLLVWLSQLGLSVALPLAGFVLLGVWLRNRFGFGIWVVLLGTAVGIICAVDGLRNSLKAMQRMSKDKKEDTTGVSFNDHI